MPCWYVSGLHTGLKIAYLQEIEITEPNNYKDKNSNPQNVNWESY